MTECIIQSSNTLVPKFTIQIPGDKSMSHRAAILGSICDKTVTFTHVLFSEDCLNTIKILSQLGAKIEVDAATHTIVCHGAGLEGLRPTSEMLDVGNSGTAIRLLTGLLSGLPFQTQLTGDHSIQNRPMKRVSDPLGQMGAIIQGQNRSGNTYPPITISPAELHGITYEMPMASAQVKSAILLAGIQARGKTTVIEPLPCRNHTELMLAGFGYPIDINGNTISVVGGHRLPGPTATEIVIPSDISSAAFSIVGALMCPTAAPGQPLLELPNIGINPTRADLLSVLTMMGANIELINQRMAGGEPVADIRVFASNLRNIEIPEQMIPNIIDEIPILAMLGLFSTGVMSVRHAEELRVKESDRIKSIVQLVLAMGGEIAEFEDGFELMGPVNITPFDIQSNGDHRIAMSAIITGIAAGVSATIHNIDCINTSFPTFFDCLPWRHANYRIDKHV